MEEDSDQPTAKEQAPLRGHKREDLSEKSYLRYLFD